MDEVTLLMSLATVLGAALASLAMWAFYGVPRVSREIVGIKSWAEGLMANALAKSAEEIAARLSEAAPMLAQQAAVEFVKAAPDLAIAFQPALVEAAETLAPVLTDALVKHGAELMAGKSNAVQSMAKQALGDVDLQQILGSPEVQGLLKSAGQGSGPLAGIGQAAGNPLAVLAPRVMKYLPKDLQALAPLLLQGLGRGGIVSGGNGGASSGSYNPGLPGRHR